MSKNIFNFIQFLLQVVQCLLIRATDPSDFQGICSVQEPLGLVGQLTDDNVPQSKTLMAWCTIREEAGVATGALVTARTLNPFVTDTQPCGAIALRGLDATGIAVTSWKGEGGKKESKSENTKPDGTKDEAGKNFNTSQESVMT